MKIVKFIITLLFGLMFLNAGLNKLFNYLPIPEFSEQLQKVNEAFATITWLMPLIGIAEIIGAILVIIPKSRALGAIILFPIMLGIILQHLYFDPTNIALAAVFAVILLWIIIDNKNKYLAMIN